MKKVKIMKIARLYTDKHNESVFEDFEIELENISEIGYLSTRFPVREIIFRETDGDYRYDFHNAPERQFIVMLNGEIEIETPKGEKRCFRSCDILLAEDTTEKGHRS